MAAIIEDKQLAYEVERHRPSQMSWGAVLAGLTLVIAGGWLLLLLGSAIGVGVIDATESGAADSVLTTGAIVWTLITTVIVYFAGAFLAARLTGKSDRSIGLLHGATVWSAGTALMVIVGYYSAVSLVQTGAQTGQVVLNQTAAMSGALGAMINGSSSQQGAVNSGSATATATATAEQASPAETSLVNDIAAQLKRRASEMIAARADQVSAGELSRAASQLDSEMLITIALWLAQGDADSARAMLAQQTTLSEQELQNLIDSANAAIGQALPQGAQQQLQDFAQQLRQRFSERLAQASAGADDDGQVSQQQIDQALVQIDLALAQRVAGELMRGDGDGARQALAEQTELSSAQINEIVSGLNREFSEQLNQLQNRFAQIVNQIQSRLQSTLGSAVASLDARGEPDVSQQEVERALAQLNGAALQDIARAMVRGDMDGVKNQLAIHTTLSEAEINDLAEGVGNAVQAQINDLRQQLDQAAEAAAGYAQAALWLSFAASVVGLAVALLGGLLGSRQAAQLSASAHPAGTA